MPATHFEGSDVFVDCTFYDEDGELAVPATAEYRIVDEGGTEIVPWTPFSGSLASTMTIQVTAAQNALSGNYRLRFVGVKFTYGAPAKTGTREYVYEIEALSTVP